MFAYFKQLPFRTRTTNILSNSHIYFFTYDSLLLPAFIWHLIRKPMSWMKMHLFLLRIFKPAIVWKIMPSYLEKFPIKGEVAVCRMHGLAPFSFTDLLGNANKGNVDHV